MDHCRMTIALAYLAGGPATSGDFARAHDESLEISRKHASTLFSRCYRRGFVSRQPYKSGRVRGFVYQLTNRGAKWMFYKSSQSEKVDLNDRKSTMEVGKESIHPPNVNVLKQNPQVPARRDFMSMKVELSLPVAYEFLRAYPSLGQRCDSLEQSYDFAMVVFTKRRSEIDCACYMCRQEWAKKLAHVRFEKNQHQEESKTRPQLEPPVTARVEERLLESYFRGSSHGLKLGIEIGRGREIASITNLLIGIALKKKIRKLPSAHASMLDGNLPKPEAQVGRGIIKTTEHAKSSAFVFPRPSAQVLKIMAGPVESLPTNASFPKKEVAKKDSHEDDWTDVNSWWRHL